jgi:hypothetical protein
MPCTHIPVSAPEKIAETELDYVLTLRWNLRDEISVQPAYGRNWGHQVR